MVEKPYLFANDRPGRRADVVALAQEAEARDFPGLFAESPGDNLALSLAKLDRTKRIAVGTGIAGIYLRHPHTMATGASLIEELHPGRFLLGLALHTYRFTRRWVSATVSLWRTCGATCETYAP
jgi:alkanesulfonate monooxygenase SsuD/methylene tetrahydromethanopterin reductase-like flavin-dependent oxidoreductase (luciferase family)